MARPAAVKGAGELGGGARAVLAARLADVNRASPRGYRRLDTLFHLSIAEHLEGTGALLRGFLALSD
jgi:hypothetical protein